MKFTFIIIKIYCLSTTKIYNEGGYKVIRLFSGDKQKFKDTKGRKLMKNFTETVDAKIMPTLSKLTENKVIKAVQYGAMATMPLTLGVALIAVLVNLPFESWTNWLAVTGIDTHMNATIKVTMEATALFMTFMIGYHHANQRGKNGLTGGILSLGAFLILMPHEIPYDGGVVEGINFTFLGADGIFGGLVLAVIISGLYSLLEEKGLVVTLPSSVPPMVAQSLSPTFIAILIFTIVFLTRVAFGFTAYGDYFTALNTVVGTPILALGATPASAIIFMSLGSLSWFFGIHPNVLLSMYLPVLMTTGTANVNAFMSGEEMPYFVFTAAMMYYALGGTGNTLGLSLLMPFTAKSERYKALGKLNIGPAIFNINEPLIFGLPIVLNPIFFIPLVLTSIVNGLMGLLFYNLGFFSNLNPTISLPWPTPPPITHLLRIGLLGLVGVVAMIIINGLIYYPFFRKADKLAYLEEQNELEEHLDELEDRANTGISINDPA